MYILGAVLAMFAFTTLLKDVPQKLDKRGLLNQQICKL